MSIPEPSLAWQKERHERIFQDDSTAFAELSEFALPHLGHFLQTQFPEQESHQHEMVAIDTLLVYHAQPAKYNPEKLNLFAYLRMAARGDMLNAIDKQSRQNQRLHNLEDPLIQEQLPSQGILSDTGNLDEWLQTHTDYSRAGIIEKLSNELNNQDQEILLLMLDNVRNHEPYAKVLNIEHLPLPEQRKIIKQNKDRLQKRLVRFGLQARR